MLVKINPESLDKFWSEYIRPLISVALPPHAANNDDAMLSVYTMAKAGKLDVWGIVFDGLSCGILCTHFIVDEITQDRNLNVFALSLESSLTIGQWKECLNQIKEYAIRLGCVNILAYTQNADILKMVHRLANVEDWKFIIIPLEQETTDGR